MSWREYIGSDPAVVAGKPLVRSTRLAVDFLLELCAAGRSPEQVFEIYPQLSNEALRPVFAFAAGATLNSSIGRGSGQTELNQII